MKLYPRVFAEIFRVLLSAFLHLFLDIRFGTKAGIPPGAKVFAVNHPTVWDAFPILTFVRKEVVHTLVEEQIWSFFLPRLIFRLANQVVLYRGEESSRTIEDALFLLRRGESILIAPEGERTAPGSDVRARRGVVRLALDGRAMIVPVGVWIDEKDIVMRPVRYRHGGREYTVDSYFPRFRARYGVLFGEPIRLDRHFGRELSREQFQMLARRVLERTYELAQEARGLFPP
jgi:1-acyl-sn-glycerol-3-phosphate acyltransferase